MIWNKLKEAIASDRFEWRKHVLQRLAERNIRQSDVIQVIMYGEIIEENLDDSPYPSALIHGAVEEKFLHVVAAFDEAHNWGYIITVYEPDLDHFEDDFKKRKRS